MARLLGAKNPAAILTAEEVKEMRKMRKKFGHSYSQLADEFAISKAQVGRILRNENWTAGRK